MAEKKPIVQKRFKGRKKKSKVYFGQATQDAIIEYNAASSSAVRNRIYTERIQAYQGRIKALRNTRNGSVEPVLDPNASPEEQQKALSRGQPNNS